MTDLDDVLFPEMAPKPKPTIPDWAGNPYDEESVIPQVPYDPKLPVRPSDAVWTAGMASLRQALGRGD